MFAYHHQHTKTPAAQSLPDIHILPMRIDTAASVQELFNGVLTRDHNYAFGTQHETVDGAVFAGPFLELKMGIV